MKEHKFCSKIKFKLYTALQIVYDNIGKRYISENNGKVRTKAFGNIPNLVSINYSMTFQFFRTCSYEAELPGLRNYLPCQQESILFIGSQVTGLSGYSAAPSSCLSTVNPLHCMFTGHNPLTLLAEISANCNEISSGSCPDWAM